MIEEIVIAKREAEVGENIVKHWDMKMTAKRDLHREIKLIKLAEATVDIYEMIRLIWKMLNLIIEE